MQVSGVGFGYLVIGYQSPDFLLQFIKLTYSYFLTMVASSLVPVIVCMVPEWREGLSQVWRVRLGWSKTSTINDSTIPMRSSEFHQADTQAYFAYYRSEW
ncbi:unnamed protein product, partial [Mesorhabditis spiculigera]